ncbi:hypothetical protein ACWDSJ_36965 [Nocardia sp. NPDC003482]
MTAPASAMCPVCLRDISDEAVCPRCRWVLRAGPWLGGITDEHRQRFDEELAEAACRYDVVAAARASGFPDRGDEVRLRRLLELVRGRATEDEIAAARRQSATARRSGSPDALADAVRWLGGDAPGTRTLTVVDIAETGVRICRLRIDSAGAAIPAEPDRLVPWQALVTGLPEDHDGAMFRLAGGVGSDAHGEPAIIPNVDAQLVPPKRISGDADERIVVLHGLPGWSLPDRIAAAFETVQPTGPESAADLLLAATSRLPSRIGYGLVAVAVDDDGNTHPYVHPLFRPGDTASAARQAPLDIAVPDTATDLIIAVVGGDAVTSPRQAVPVSVWRCPPGDCAGRLQFTLERPGVISLIAPTAARRETVKSWTGLLDRIPPIYQPDRVGLDLAVVIELAGNPGAVTRRRELVGEIADLLERDHPRPESVRVAVLGYDDHLGRRPQSVLRGGDFGPLSDARTTVGEFAASRVLESLAAPLEDALAGARRLTWRTPAVTRRLVIIGGRPPHPAQDGLVAACPNRHDWRGHLTWLRRFDVVRSAVWDRPEWCAKRSPASREANTVWRALAPPGRTVLLDDATAADVAARAGLIEPEPPAAPLNFPILSYRK